MNTRRKQLRDEETSQARRKSRLCLLFLVLLLLLLLPFFVSLSSATLSETMVFPSMPAYLDPSNWQQQTTSQIGSSSRPSSQLLPPQPPPPPPIQPTHGGATSGPFRPGSMSERARMANVPLPEAALKCPRCDSTNTKFCYFNNYSLTQPRHFCKTCRRYWTRGGALRNVPVGGGCRRNKRRKGSSSKSPVSSGNQSGGAGSSSMISSSSGHADISSLEPQIPPLKFMAPVHSLNEFSSGDIGFNYGFNYSTLSSPMSGPGDQNFQPGVTVSGGAGSLLGLDQQWRIQQMPQFPVLPGFDPSTALFERQSSLKINHLSPIKMEETQQDQGGRQFLGSVAGNEQLWIGNNNAWSELSGFSSSSTTSNHP